MRNDYILTDTERFSVMIKKYEDIYVHYETFAQKIGVKRSTVHNWGRVICANIRETTKTKICKAFNLQYTVWTDIFYNKITFSNSLNQYEKTSYKTIDKKILGTKTELVGDEEDKLATLSSLATIILDEDIKSKSSQFLFELIAVLKNNNQINEALEVIDILQKRDTTYKYYYHNELQHYKAILLSHEKIQKFDEAIDILRTLYSASHYHLKEPEIITLMASNYKRKALQNPDEISLELLSSAAILYAEAYELKDMKHKYYDAINLAYMYKLLEHFEHDGTELKTIETLYKELSLHWRPDPSNWWEVSTQAEFHMLLGDVQIAIQKLKEFIDFEEVNIFEIETLQRQLKLYIDFSDDDNAKLVYDFMDKYI